MEKEDQELAKGCAMRIDCAIDIDALTMHVLDYVPYYYETDGVARLDSGHLGLIKLYQSDL